MMSRVFRWIGIFASAMLITLSLGLDMAVANNLRPDGLELFGHIYQMLGRLVASFKMERLTASILMVAFLWLCQRYLFQKSKCFQVGEYLLSSFLGLMMMLSETVRTQDTVAILWENGFQFGKTVLTYFGLVLFFLVLLRSLAEMILYLRKKTDSNVMMWFDRKYSSFRIGGFILAFWLPQIIARYPGVIMWDSFWQIHQFFGNAERISSHPPFGTLMYGGLAAIGDAIGSRNTAYYIFVLIQNLLFMVVLTYSLMVMKRQRVNAWIRFGTLLTYAISPCFSAWAGTIAKDSAYQIGLFLAATELLVFVNEREFFFKDWRHLLLLSISFLWMTLNRHNGAPLAILLILFMGLLLLKEKRVLIKVVICGAASVVLATTITNTISTVMQIRKPYMQDVMSLPLQQTARVILLHQEEIPAEEVEIIDRVVQYDNLGENYVNWYADSVKDTYRQSATSQERAAYWKVWFKQMMRWPVDYLDAALHMNGVLFNLNDNKPMYVSLSNNDLYNYVYPYSFNDLSLYESNELIPFDSAQRMMAEWYMDFDRIPMVGMLGSMSFHTIGMLMLVYLCWKWKERKALLVWTPCLFTFGMCLFAPVVYLRYALPLIGAFPTALACMTTQRES